MTILSSRRCRCAAECSCALWNAMKSIWIWLEMNVNMILIVAHVKINWKLCTSACTYLGIFQAKAIVVGSRWKEGASPSSHPSFFSTIHDRGHRKLTTRISTIVASRADIELILLSKQGEVDACMHACMHTYRKSNTEHRTSTVHRRTPCRFSFSPWPTMSRVTIDSNWLFRAGLYTEMMKTKEDKEGWMYDKKDDGGIHLLDGDWWCCESEREGHENTVCLTFWRDQTS